MTAAPRPAPSTTATVQDESPEDLQAQQENFRALLRQAAPAQGQQQEQQRQQQLGQLGPFGQRPGAQGGDDEEDPAVKLLHSLIGGNMPTGDQGGNGTTEGPSQADLLAALGVPPFLTSMAGAATRTRTETEKKEAARWKIIHVLFAVVMGVYVLVLIGRSVATFGSPPPPPATARNPFLVFTTGEMVLSGARMAMKPSAGGLGRVSQCVEVVGDVVRDGSLVVFVLGLGVMGGIV